MIIKSLMCFFSHKQAGGWLSSQWGFRFPHWVHAEHQTISNIQHIMSKLWVFQQQIHISAALQKVLSCGWQTVTINFKWLRKLTRKAAEKHQPILPGSHLMEMFGSWCWCQEASKNVSRVPPRSRESVVSSCGMRRKCLMATSHSGFWSELVSLDVVKVLG